MKATVSGVVYDCDDEWSFKNFSNRPVPDLPDGIVVYATQFYHETDYAPFREDMTGVTFVKCNLDNLTVPPGNTIVECTERRWRRQNDGNEWLINGQDKPTKPLMGDKQFLKRGFPLPKWQDIPSEPVAEAVDLIKAAKVKKDAE